MKSYSYGFFGQMTRWGGFLGTIMIIPIIFFTKAADILPFWAKMILIIISLIAAFLQLFLYPYIGTGSKGLYLQSFGMQDFVPWEALRVVGGRIEKTRMIIFLNKHGLFQRKFFFVSPFLQDYPEFLAEVQQHLPA